MVYTSGTSGRPKGVRRPLTGEDPDKVPPTARWFFGIFSLAPFDQNVHLCCSPLYHTAVLNFATISIQLGHPVVLMDRFEPEEMLRLIERHRVTHTHMVPTQFRRLLALPEPVRGRYDTSSLRAAIHSAAPCPQDVKRRMLDWWGPVVTEYYAASEGGGTGITAAEWLARPGSVGRAWPGSEVRVLDADGNDVPVGEPGLVYMRMGTSTFDYHQDEEWGEEIKAVVQPVPGSEPGPALTSELLAFLSGRVAKFKLPKSIDYVSELPRDPNGKLYKRRLRDPYWAARDRSI